MHEWHIHLGHGEVCQIKPVAIGRLAGTDWRRIELREESVSVPTENGNSNGVPNDVCVPPLAILDESLETQRHRHVFVYGIYNARHSKLAHGATIVAIDMTVIARQKEHDVSILMKPT